MVTSRCEQTVITAECYNADMIWKWWIKEHPSQCLQWKQQIVKDMRRDWKKEMLTGPRWARGWWGGRAYVMTNMWRISTRRVHGASCRLSRPNTHSLSPALAHPSTLTYPLTTTTPASISSVHTHWSHSHQHPQYHGTSYAPHHVRQHHHHVIYHHHSRSVMCSGTSSSGPC